MPRPSPSEARWPALPGTYVLVMAGAPGQVLRYGGRRHRLQPGWYLYVGSARGPGGLAARLRHHCRLAPRPHWHIDRARRLMALVECWAAVGGESLEHRWAECLAATARSVAGFGAGDCRCRSHLFHFRDRPGLRWWRRTGAGAAASERLATTGCEGARGEAPDGGC